MLRAEAAEFKHLGRYVFCEELRWIK